MRSATLWIIAANVLVFMIVRLLILFHPGGADFVMDIVALKPAFILSGKYLWTIITSMFTHVFFFHLFANMFSLLFLGSFLERIIRQKRFLALYFGAGIAGALLFIAASAITGEVDISAVGASGAVFGVAGMLAVLTPKVPVYIMFIPIAIPMWLGVILILTLLWVLSISLGLPIGNTAHLGGLLVGVGYAFYLRYRYKRKAKMIAKFYSR